MNVPIVSAVPGHNVVVVFPVVIIIRDNLTEGQLTKEKPSAGKVAFYVVDILILTPLLSWLYVGYQIDMFVKARINKAAVPEKLKEINFKLSSIDLPKEQVKGLRKSKA